MSPDRPTSDPSKYIDHEPLVDHPKLIASKTLKSSSFPDTDPTSNELVVLITNLSSEVTLIERVEKLAS